ncbi:MAG: hypothetical protein QM725_07900 [Lacibacter sp.]
MRTLIYILLLFVLASCNQINNNRHKSNLQIAVNSDYEKYLWYPSINRQAKDSSFYDSLKNFTVTQFDSLKNGKVQISIYSLLTDNYENTIDLNKDTLIVFDTTLYHKLKKTNNINQFKALTRNMKDTIFIGQKVVGCFGGEIEKAKIYKTKENKYVIEYSNSKNQSSTFIDNSFERHFEEFLEKSKALFPDKANWLTFAHLSTTHIDTYIRQGNYVLEFPDLYDWKGYDNFKNQLGIYYE